MMGSDEDELHLLSVLRERFASPERAAVRGPERTLRGAAPAQRLKTATVNIRIDPVLKEAAERAAETERRTLTSLIEFLLTEHCRSRGVLTSDGTLERV
jgi:hypothetical protein